MKEKTSSQVNSEEHEVEPDEQNKREEQDDVPGERKLRGVGGERLDEQRTASGLAW